MDRLDALLVAQSALRERQRNDSAKAVETNNKFWSEGVKEAEEALDIIKSMLKELRA